MSSAVDAQLRRRNLRTIGLLAAIFFLPLIASFAMYYGGSWRPAASTAHGELYHPARPLPKAELRHADGSVAPIDVFADKWTLVYVGNGTCDEACADSLYFMRQTRLSLNQEMTRVARVFFGTGECCSFEAAEKKHPGLVTGVVTIDAAGPNASELVAAFPTTEREHSLFVVDPLGNLVMRYDARDTPKGLLDDLKKLLKLSHIG